MPCATAPSIRRRPTPHCLQIPGCAALFDHRDKLISQETSETAGLKLPPSVYNICDIMASDSPPADQLFVKCSHGDQSAAGEFYRRYHSAICAVAIRIVRQWRLPHLANDAVHHVYLKLWSNQCRALVTFQDQGPNSDMAYVRVLAANAASDFCKSLRTRPDQRGDAVPIDKVPAPAAEDNRAMVNLQLEDAERCLRRHLPAEEIERDLQIVKLFFLFEFTAAHIGRLSSIGLSAAGVESVIHRCRKAFAKCFAQPKGKTAA